MAEMAAEFDLARVNKNAAQFDVRKLEAINGDKIRALGPADFAARITPFLAAAGLVADPPTAAEAELITAAAPLVQERVTTLAEAAEHARVPVRRRGGFPGGPGGRGAGAHARRRAGAGRRGGGAGRARSRGPRRRSRRRCGPRWWTGLGLKPRAAFGGAVRVAVTGRRVAPPLFESIELLGRDRTLARLARARASVAGGGGQAGG